MLQLVSRFLQRSKSELSMENAISQYLKQPSPNILVSTGTLVYHVDRRGYFALQTDDGRQLFPFNAREFPKLLKDRLRVRFVLETHPDIPNYYKWGMSCRLISMEPIEA